MSNTTTLAIVRSAACALALGLPALASGQSLYDDPRPKKQYPPTLTPPAAAAATKLAFDTPGCASSTRMDCAPKSVASERSVAHFVPPTVPQKAK